MTPQSHFIAKVSVEKVTSDREPYQTDSKRAKATLANIVVSAPTLEAVLEKAAKHLALVEDGGDIDGGALR